MLSLCVGITRICRSNYIFLEYVITGIKLGGMLLLNKLSVFVSTIYEYQNIAYIWFDILNAMMSN